ncbi:hypothetical protein [Methylomusa anaerophila]|uniref:hypothetical protein n=1 Tax=Methylomusa anaerophila TaxID=1930071 RepID=UPI0011AE889C|nr:hypothetical protein [Methylomusa anaerophila]
MENIDKEIDFFRFGKKKNIEILLSGKSRENIDFFRIGNAPIYYKYIIALFPHDQGEKEVVR